MDRLSPLLDLHAQLLSELEERFSSAQAREAEAKRVLAKCTEEMGQIERERDALKQAEQIYRQVFGVELEAPGPYSLAAYASKPAKGQMNSDDALTSTLRAVEDAHVNRPRARIGPKRYVMLELLEVFGPLSDDEIVNFTKISGRRVRAQMASDVNLGMVEFVKHAKLALTPAGQDLLHRFRAYKRARNEPLPTLDEITRNPEADDDNTTDAEKSASDFHASSAHIFSDDGDI